MSSVKGQRRRKALQRAKYAVVLGCLLGAGLLASGALGMTFLDENPPAETSSTAPPPTSTGSGSTLSPSIKSDLEDYNPGATVTLTGSGWVSGEAVHIFVNDDVGQLWSLSADVTAGASGELTYAFQLPSFFVANYSVTATGSSGSVARTTFTDSNPQSLTVASPTDVTVVQGATAVFGTATVGVGGNTNLCTITLSVSSGLPAGATPEFGTNPLSTTGANVSTSFAVSTTAATPVGVYTFAVTAQRGGNCQGSADLASSTLMLRVTSACTAPVVTTHPTDVSIAYGANASFTAAASGTSPSIQWQVSTDNGLNFNDLIGQTSSPLAFINPPASLSGNKYRAVFTNACGSATSNAATLTIAKKGLTIDGAVANNKTYDGTTNAIVDFNSATLAGVVSGDTVTIDTSGYSAHFDDKNAGNNKPVTVTGVALGGADAGNYTVTQPSGLAANIGKRDVTASIAANDKTYDRTDAATISDCSLNPQSGDVGTIASDDIDCSASNGHFSDANADPNKPVMANVALIGGDAANYQLTSATAATTASITKRDVTASITAADKTYDGTDAASIMGCSLESQSGDHGVVSPDDVGCSGSDGHFDNKNVGLNKAVTAAVALAGADKDNYQLTGATASTTANVTKAPLTVKADDKTMILNGTVPALTYAISGFVGGETLAGSGVTGTASCSTADGTVAGTFPITCATGSLSADNYSFSFAAGTLTVNYAASCQGAPVGNPILQPINNDGSSTFKQGSTVPLKFRACDANGVSVGPTTAVPNIVASFVLDHTSNGTPGVNEAIDSTTPDTAFRWSATDKQWIFNLSTRNLGAGKTYYYKVTLVGGASFQVVFGLK